VSLEGLGASPGGAVNALQLGYIGTCTQLKANRTNHWGAMVINNGTATFTLKKHIGEWRVFVVNEQRAHCIHSKSAVGILDYIVDRLHDICVQRPCLVA